MGMVHAEQPDPISLAAVYVQPFFGEQDLDVSGTEWWT